jgi:colanic acid biosynthesis glycosyl transferase WcaI
MAKIAYLSPYFWPETIGSAPYCTDVARWLQQRGHEVHVLAFRPHYPSAEDFHEWSDGARDEEVFEGIRITRLAVAARDGGGFAARLKNDLRYFRGALRTAVRRDFADVDVVVAYVPSCLALLGGMALARRSRARFIGVVHDIESGLAASLGMAQAKGVLWAMRKVEQLAFNRADHLIVLSPAMELVLRELGCSRPVTAIPIWSSPLPRVALDVSHAPVVCYSGNFGKKQHLEQILPLIGMLNERRPEVRVVLRGDGTERARIQQRVEDMGTSNTVFRMLASSEEFAAALQEATVHLVPQARDTASYALPSKVFSIMAAGRPFVCIAEPKSPLELLTNETGAGICVAPEDHEGLFNAVDSMLSDLPACERMGERGRAFVQQNMGRKQILSQYERVILGASA